MKNIHLLPTEKPSRISLHTTGLYNLACELYENSPNFSNRHIYITSDEEIGEEDWCYSIRDKWIKKCINPNSLLEKELHCKKIILTTDQELIASGVQPIDDNFLEWFVKNPSCNEIEIVKVPYFDESGYSYLIGIPQEEPKQEYNYIGECKGNNDDGCFQDSPAHNCGCFTRVPKQELTIPQGYYDQDSKDFEQASLDDFKEQETLEEAAEKYCLIRNIPIDQMIVKTDRSCEFETPVTMFKNGAKWQAERMYSEEEVLDLLYKRDLYLLNRDEEVELELPDEWFEQFKKK